MYIDEYTNCVYCNHAKMWHDKTGCKFDYPCRCTGFDKEEEFGLI